MEHEFRMTSLGNADQGGGDADRGWDCQSGTAKKGFEVATLQRVKG